MRKSKNYISWVIGVVFLFMNLSVNGAPLQSNIQSSTQNIQTEIVEKTINYNEATKNVSSKTSATDLVVPSNDLIKKNPAAKANNTTVYSAGMANANAGATSTSTNVSAALLGPNLISNGDFSAGTTGWNLANTSSGSSTMSVSSGVLNVVVSNSGTLPNAVTLTKNNLALEKDVTYVITFYASSSIARSIKEALRNSATTQEHFTKTVALSTTLTKFEYTFTQLQADSSVSLTFNLGKVTTSVAKHTIKFDNISLMKKLPPDTTSPSIPANLTWLSKTTTTIQLSWDKSTDNVAVSGYDVYKNGAFIASTTSNTYTSTALVQGGLYSYTVKAKDTSGNYSAFSNRLSIHTIYVNSVPVSYESEHPYQNNKQYILNLTVVSPQVTNVSASFSIIDVESKYDYLKVSDTKTAVSTYTGYYKTGAISNYVSGNSISIILTTNAKNTKYGYKMNYLNVALDYDIPILEAPTLALSDTGGELALSFNYVSGVSYTVSRKIDNGAYIDVATSLTSGAYLDNDTNAYGLYYYKVKASKDGTTKESNEVCAIKNQEFSGAITNDTDKDAIPDQIETDVTKTDINKIDTDGDGLTDGYEYYSVHTDPTKLDSDGNGVNDANEDMDKDGLTNSSEFTSSTNPVLEDTDKDSLTDGDEINSYKTNPLKPDTDLDGLDDGSEIKLGFNPLNQDSNSNGIIDSKENILQPIDNSVYENINTTDNVAKVQLTVNGQGDVNEKIIIADESTNPNFENNRSIVGKPIDINYDGAFKYADLQFKVEDSVMEGRDINNFVVCWFDEVNNTVVPVQTAIDTTQNVVSARLTHFSQYFVLDKGHLAKQLGSSTDGTVKGQADIVFVVDTTGSMSDKITNVKNNISTFVNELYLANVNVNLGLVVYKDLDSDGSDSTQVLPGNSGNWFYNPEEFKTKLDSLLVSGGGDYPESAIDALETARKMDFRTGVQKYIILLTDASYKIGNNYGITSLTDETDKMLADNITNCVITSSHLLETYQELFTRTGGIFADIYGVFASELATIKQKIQNDMGSGTWIALSNLNVVRVNKLPDVNDTTTDSDSDGIVDSAEIVVNEAVHFLSYRLYRMKTDPSKPDTDRDGANDADDILPTVPFKTPVMLLHGRTDNSSCWGIDTPIAGYDSLSSKMFAKNNTFINRLKLLPEEVATKEEYFTNPENQKIYGIRTGIKATPGWFGENVNNATPYNMVEVLSEKGYNWRADNKKPLSLYVFNYPNVDMVQQNGELLKKYIDRVIDKVTLSNNTSWQGGIFKTWKDMNNSSPIFQFDLIGHSMGGLVSRYYIENMFQYNHVRKLITIDTPHWGSGLATISVFSGIQFSPCDVDLNPSSSLYGFDKVSINSSAYDDKTAYAYAYQSDPFLNHHTNSKYYAIAGYDYGEQLPSDFDDQDMFFEVTVMEHSSFSSFYDSIALGYKKKVGDLNSIMFPFKMTSTSGDNVVNNQSQLGVNFDFMGVSMYKTSINIDPFINAIWNPFHSQNQHRKEVCYGVTDYLAE